MSWRRKPAKERTGLRSQFGLPNPLTQQVAAAVTDQVGEGVGQVAGVGDVGAGQADLLQSTGLAVGGSPAAA
jgi:hypothetical protein